MPRVATDMSRPPRFDGSLLSSLAELRAIKEERVAAERAALIAADDTRRRDIELAEERKVEVEARRGRGSATRYAWSG